MFLWQSTKKVYQDSIPGGTAQTEEAGDWVLEDMERPAIDAHTVVHVVVDILKQGPLQLDTENKTTVNFFHRITIRGSNNSNYTEYY